MDEKFGWEKQRIIELIKSISKVTIVLKTIPGFRVISDEPDNRILECALKANADVLVTGDKHLLKLKRYKNFEIAKLSAFLRVLQ